MPDSISHERMRQGVFRFVLFLFFFVYFVLLLFACSLFQLGITLLGSFVFACCVVFNQKCSKFTQYNLFEGCCKWILRQLWIQVTDYSLSGLTWHIRLRTVISHLSVSRIVDFGRVIFPIAFIFLLFFMIVCWLIFVFWFVFISLGSSLNN